MKKTLILCLLTTKISGIAQADTAKSYVSVQQNGTAITAVGTAAIDLTKAQTFEFVNGKAVMTVGSNKVAELPMTEGGQLVVSLSGTESNVTKELTSEYATLYSPFQLQVPEGSDVEVYAPTYDSQILRLNDDTKVAAGTIIPAGTGLILKNSGSISFTFSDGTAANLTSALSGSAIQIAKPTENGKTVYTLGHKSGAETEYGFFVYEGTTMNAGYAYLFTETVSGAKAIQLSFDDEADGISTIIANDSQPKSCKFIENGRVVIVKNGQKYNLNGQEIK